MFRSDVHFVSGGGELYGRDGVLWTGGLRWDLWLCAFYDAAAGCTTNRPPVKMGQLKYILGRQITTFRFCAICVVASARSSSCIRRIATCYSLLERSCHALEGFFFYSLLLGSVVREL